MSLYQINYRHPKYPEKFLAIFWNKGYTEFSLHYLGEVVLTANRNQLLKGVTIDYSALGKVFLRLSIEPVDFELRINDFHSPDNRRHPAKRLQVLKYVLAIPLLFYGLLSVFYLTSPYVIHTEPTMGELVYSLGFLGLIVVSWIGFSYRFVWLYIVLFILLNLQGLLGFGLIGMSMEDRKDFSDIGIVTLLALLYFLYTAVLMGYVTVICGNFLRHRKNEISREEILID